MTQRDVAAAWTAALADAGLPLVEGGAVVAGRDSLRCAAPRRDGRGTRTIDVVLTERWPSWRVREALAHHMPDGWRLIDAFDVWLGGPPLAGRVVAADYRIELAGAPDASVLGAAATDLMAATSISRERVKGGSTVTYDLRPLVTSIAIRPGPPVLVRTRTRFDPELGTGRPEEVLGALGDRLDRALEIAAIVREQLLLAVDATCRGPARPPAEAAGSSGSFD